MSPDFIFEEFCDRVCAHVRFKPDHPSIKKELTGHLEDRRDALLEREDGMLPADAHRAAVAAMGDPETLGRYLDRMHSPFWGWLQIWLRRATWVLVIALLLNFVGSFPGSFVYSFARYDQFKSSSPKERLLYGVPEHEVLSSFQPDAVLNLGDYTFTLENVIVIQHDSASMPPDFPLESRVLYSDLKVTDHHFFIRCPDVREWLYAEDDTGNRYDFDRFVHPTAPADSFGTLRGNYAFRSGTGLFSDYYDLELSPLPPSAAEITFYLELYGEDYRLFTIPLEGGEEHA